jgi:hypothetical protein
MGASSENCAGAGVACADRACLRRWYVQYGRVAAVAGLAADGDEVAPPVCRRPPGGLVGRASAGCPTRDFRPADRTRNHQDAGRGPAERGYALVDSLDGQRDGNVADGNFPDMAGFRAQAAPGADLETEHRSAVRGQGPRRGRPVHGPAGERAGALRGREKPDAGAGSHRADPASHARHASGG